MKTKKKRPLGRPRVNEQNKPTKQVILQSATDLFLANGFQDVSVDEVAMECNVTKATVYYYFESKAQLFTETMVQMMLRIRDHMNDILMDDEVLRNRLHKVTIGHLRATFDLDLEGFLRESKNSLTKEQLHQMQEAEDKMFEALEEAFIKAIQVGEIPKINTKFAAHSYMQLLKVGNYRDKNQNAIFSSIDETAEKIMDFFWNGLFP